MPPGYIYLCSGNKHTESLLNMLQVSRQKSEKEYKKKKARLSSFIPAAGSSGGFLRVHKAFGFKLGRMKKLFSAIYLRLPAFAILSNGAARYA